ncbi:bifunctional 3-(3-hydroxy-phenyl)propionate/3-hydroxycinnamic acid hydroxylase [Ramlibacter henchirensis]|uniref:bifunctional 3-(3-hydroxy-phenyl)propionate/3-hydroxycinnamic acid hydroxylase n=1 Tax=Ramlibacter henchirensis TaxID=204072 RepID=UPI00142FD334|nr:bifunctional 3-(3-hydroxy-phenyl)propionate/3-hydroxycinnamic acid hydroxylase [Ramlibacter henchirensis]
MSPPLPVLIVGAGPTGLVLANLLGQRGVPAVVIEKRSDVWDIPRAIAFDDESLRSMQGLGLAHALRARLVEGCRARYFRQPAARVNGRTRPLIRFDPRPGLYGFEKINSFAQPDLERIWRDELARFAHVQLRFGWAFESFRQDAEGVTVTVKNAAGQVQELRGSYLVACDGGRSPVRECAGIAMEGSSFVEKWLVIDTVNDTKNDACYTFYCHPSRPSMEGQGPKGMRRYEFMLLPGETEEQLLRDDTIERLVAYDKPLQRQDLWRKTVYTFHARKAAALRRGRVLIAGDAAHMMPPFAGQGMNSGIRDAANLAWKLELVLLHGAGDRILDSYEAERRPHFERLMRLSVRLGRFVMTRQPALALLRNTIYFTIESLPPVKRWITDRNFNVPSRHRAGLYQELGRACGLARVGEMLPQPRVGARHGGGLLDEHLGTGFALLVPPGGGTDTGVHVLQRSHVGRRLAPRVVEVGPGALELDSGKRLLAPGMAALVRPDRFVAAIFPVAEAGAQAPALEALFGLD